MLHHVFAVLDTKAGAFYPPFLSLNHQTAARSVGDLVADRNHLFGKHPEDFHLFYLGTFEDGSAAFQLVPAEDVCLLSDLLKRE